MQGKLLLKQIGPLGKRQLGKETGRGELLQQQPEQEEDVQKQPAEEQEEKTARAKENGAARPRVTQAVESGINSSRGGGRPLEESESSFFGPRFGADFSGVRIHNDSSSAALANQLNAQAFTVGGDIYFGAGRYAPETTQGKRLMGHELTHVVQQGGASSLQSTSIAKKQNIRPQAPRDKSTTPDIQCGFWDDPWGSITSLGRRALEGVRSVGRAIGRGASAAWDWISGVGRTIGRGISAAWGWIRNVGRAIGRGALAAWEWIKGVGRAIGRGVAAAWEWVKGVGRAIGRGIVAAWEWIKELGRTIGRGIVAAWEWIKAVARRIGKALSEAWEWIKELARRIQRGILQAWEWLKRIGRVAWDCIKGIVWGAAAGTVQRKPAGPGRRQAKAPANASPGRGAVRRAPLVAGKNVRVGQRAAHPSIQRYSEDIHYYKTLEDAVKVGYGPIQAGTVAFEDQAVDTGWRHPWITTPVEIVNPRVSGKDMLHFASRGVAVGDMSKAINICDLKAFGAGLHRFQDTFSHNFTTWTIPVRRLCASWCWKINPLLAAPILLPKHAHGRGAALKHACLGFYPDEHHAEQKGRDATMRSRTRHWLKQFLTKCSGPSSGAKGKAASTGLTFSSAAFNAGTGGTLTATPEPTRVTLMSPLYNPSGKVKVSGGTDALAQDWQAGFIQTMKSALRKAHYLGSKKHKLRTVSIPGARRDAFVQSGAPWYDPNNQNASAPAPFTKTNSTVSSQLKDNPATRPPWDTSDGKGKLDRHEGKDTFTAWMIARKKTPPHTIEHINWTSWEVGWGASFNYASSGAKTVKKITGSTKNTGSGAKKGSNTPVLSGTIANTELNSNIVWS